MPRAAPTTKGIDRCLRQNERQRRSDANAGKSSGGSDPSHDERTIPESAIKRAWVWKVAAALLVLSIIAAVAHNRTERRLINAARGVTSETQEITSGFIPLIHGELSGDSVQIVRVKLPRSSLLQFGLPVNIERQEQMIEAEVVVGEEGLPHAIRFIQQKDMTSQKEEK